MVRRFSKKVILINLLPVYFRFGVDYDQIHFFRLRYFAIAGRSFTRFAVKPYFADMFFDELFADK